MGYNRAQNYMKKLFLSFAIIIAAMFLSSCASNMVPLATNTINTVRLEEMNLVRADYEVLNTVEASARVQVTMSKKKLEIIDPDGEFSLEFKKKPISLRKLLKGSDVPRWVLKDFDGVMRAGYLANDYGSLDWSSADDVVRRIAIYRVISLAKEEGADGIIEPIISTNFEQTSSKRRGDVFILNTTVSGKAIKLKTDK